MTHHGKAESLKVHTSKETYVSVQFAPVSGRG
jgi:hypothetical protein